MMKYMLLLLVVVTVYAGGRENGPAGRHHHKRQVEVYLTGANLTITFHAPMAESYDEVEFDVDGGVYRAVERDSVLHGEHIDWIHTFTDTTILPCDEIDVIITGWPTGENFARTEFDGEFDMPPNPGGDC